MSNYTTGELAKICNVSVRTVQYYDSRGILIPTELSEGGRRLYSEEDLSKMKIICFLKELNFSLDAIARIFKEDNSKDVINAFLEEKIYELNSEIKEKEQALDKVKSIIKLIPKDDNFTVKSLNDVAYIMENKNKTRKLHINLILLSIPLEILQWIGIVVGIKIGVWWPAFVYLLMIAPFAIFITKYYFDRVEYICPNCHEIFTPNYKKAFFASHTPNTRKLVCPCCKNKSYCIETHRKEK